MGAPEAFNKETKGKMKGNWCATGVPKKELCENKGERAHRGLPLQGNLRPEANFAGERALGS